MVLSTMVFWRLSVCLPAYLSTCLPTCCLSVCLPVCLPTSLPIRPPVYQTCLSDDGVAAADVALCAPPVKPRTHQLPLSHDRLEDAVDQHRTIPQHRAVDLCRHNGENRATENNSQAGRAKNKTRRDREREISTVAQKNT